MVHKNLFHFMLSSNMKQYFLYKNGFSLLEMMLYVAMVGIIGMSLFSLLGVVVDTRTKQLAVQEVEGQGTVLLRMISQQLRNSTTISVPAANTSGNILTWSTIGSALSPASYSLLDGAVMLQESTNAPIKVTSNRVRCTNFVVRHVGSDPSLVQLSITLRSESLGQSRYTYEKTFTTSITLRS